MPGPFTAALDELHTSGRPYWGPHNFQDYLKKHGLKADTARSISVDAHEDLDRELRERQTMVLRMGNHHGRGTSFVLVRCDSVRSQFYLEDAAFSRVPAQVKTQHVGAAQLAPFQVLPQFSEYALLSLVIASGALGEALGLENSRILPASGHFTADFAVKPLAAEPQIFSHQQGQVEVDALFYGVRDGRPLLVVVESKRDGGLRSLAKHKLVYPLLALAPKVDPSIRLLPVYVRLRLQPPSGLGLVVELDLMECAFPENGALEELQPVRILRHVVHLDGLPREPKWRKYQFRRE